MKFLASMNKVVLLFFLFISLSIGAQEITVLDADSNEPIMNVAVFNTDKSTTAISDFDGKCDLSLFDKNERITFKHLGYEIYKTTTGQILKRNRKVYLIANSQQLDEVVMSISKWEQQKKDIPQKIISIDAKSIAFTNPQTSADLLQNSGKVFVQKSQLGGGSPMIRGFSTNRLLLSVDGVRMNNAIFRGGNIQNIISIDPYTIKNTEVVFGPGSVIYGSDAIGGVINFFTKKAEFSTTDSLAVMGNANYRYSTANSENTGHFDINLGLKKWAFLTSVTYNDFGDLKMGKHGPDSYLRKNYVQTINGEDVLVPNANDRLQVPTGYNQINVLQKIAFKPNTDWNLNWSNYYSETSDYSRYDRLIRPNGSGDGLRSAEWYYGPQKWFMSNLQFSKNGKGRFYDGLKITTAYQHFEESRVDRGFQNVTRYTTLEKVDALSSNIDFENKRIGDLQLYYGTEYVYNKVHSFGHQKNIETNEIAETASRYPDGSTWQTLAGYLNTEYKAKPNLSLLSGIRYSHVWVNAEFDTNFYQFPFDNADLSTGALTGSIGLSWFPKANLQITANTSTGFRAPNIDDVGKIFDSEPGSVVVPNPDLEPEYAYNVELGVQKNIKDKVMLKGTTFYTYLVDALVRRDFEFNGMTEIEYNGELSNVQAIQNAAKAYVYGFEFGIDATINENISLVSNLTLTQGIEEEEDGTDSPGRHVAPTFGDVHVIWKNQRLKTDLFLNYNGEVSFNDLAVSEQSKDYIYAADANGNPYAPSWYTLNFRSQYVVSNALKTSVSLENITNQRYRSYSSGIVAPGINLILALEYQF
ncbi:TonB-dependent receptor [Cellulophaga tyrosinoxydans]|uniref:Hemoglobin/transferrin/lactoferrin receptor protein n=1 Tax=Cellulophaga tyrosinoxydans TaxID=504486 RepID=A0A1W1Z4H3_9FLAO|nr:TonB-dependent receptor [Cellulophaga tyrosinoxydans]SMC42858.1 hemoglobin/transferrin/lactoferrin receptor protein [Cellulophaga tyrosinoxydans]